ncbi:hypothetical protein HK102_011574, partial [Quaeritorhiza haematococci]
SSSADNTTSSSSTAQNDRLALRQHSVDNSQVLFQHTLASGSVAAGASTASSRAVGQDGSGGRGADAKTERGKEGRTFDEEMERLEAVESKRGEKRVRDDDVVDVGSGPVAKKQQARRSEEREEEGRDSRREQKSTAKREGGAVAASSKAKVTESASSVRRKSGGGKRAEDDRPFRQLLVCHDIASLYGTVV